MVMADPRALDAFEAFCAARMCAENVLFLRAARAYRGLAPGLAPRRAAAKIIRPFPPRSKPLNLFVFSCFSCDRAAFPWLISLSLSLSLWLSCVCGLPGRFVVTGAPEQINLSGELRDGCVRRVETMLAATRATVREFDLPPVAPTTTFSRIFPSSPPFFSCDRSRARDR